MAKSVALYITDNIDVLDAVCLEAVKSFKNIGNVDSIRSSLKKLASELKSLEDDEEKAYIFGTRYLLLFDYMLQHIEDKKFINILYTQEHKSISDKVNKLRKSLTDRYERLAREKSLNIPNIPSIPEPIDKIAIINEQFITCKELYCLLEDGDANVLLIDIRSEKDFNTSRINTTKNTLINIPEEIIQRGLSANTLGEKLVGETCQFWDKRDCYNLLVLIDFKSSEKNLCSAKIEQLKSILMEWDCNRNYKQPPRVLAGGFKEFLETYPSMVTNSHHYLIFKNNELDELLEIDDIEYPLENDVKDKVQDDDSSLDELLNQNVESTVSLDDIKSSLIENTDFPIDPKPQEIPENDKPVDNFIEDKQVIQEGDISKIKEEIEAARIKELSKARALKPITLMQEFPTIDRSKKPTTLRINIRSGLVGLKNIKNTCYQNTIIQIIRCIPVIRNTFLQDLHLRVIKKPTTIIAHELGDLVKALWTLDVRSYSPISFYEKICKEEENFARGNHEDCMEFFLFLYNKLAEDFGVEVRRPDTLTPSQKDWFHKIGGRSSIIVDWFNYQIKTQRECRHCNVSSYFFDQNPELLISLPENKNVCELQDMVDNELKDYIISDYLCMKCKRPVLNRPSVVRDPRILVVHIKRGVGVEGRRTRGQKSNTSVNFTSENLKFGRSSYTLWGLGLHTGTVDAGHYRAVCKINDGWYLFNDERVTRTDLNVEEFKSNVSCLFYAK